MPSTSPIVLTGVQHDASLASFARQGFRWRLGARIVSLEAGRAVEMQFDDGVSQQRGLLHGGAIGALADTAGGYAAMTFAPDGHDVVTMEYRINVLRPRSARRCWPRGWCCAPGDR